MTVYGQGKLLVISGPSAGVGKDTVMQLFLKQNPDWMAPISTTTRPARRDEIDGKNMHFVSLAEFQRLKSEGKFLEAFMVNNQWYGTLRGPVEEALKNGKNVILRKDVQGALAIKKALPSAITIFIRAESDEALEQRLRSRATEKPTEIEKRLRLAKQELLSVSLFDHLVVNPSGHPEKDFDDLTSVVGGLNSS
ncbi:guanylate kinase, partial [Candidatus Microgenomates bacterium]|nr:guanylate kinase [Candidatus Microgenomates bacterium]